MPFYYNFQFFLDYSHSIYLIDVFYNHIIKFPQTSFVITFAVTFTLMTVLKEDHFLFHLCNFSLTMVYLSFYSNTLLNILPCTIFSISHKYFLMSLLVLFYNFSCFKIFYLLPLQFFHFIFHQVIALKLFLRSTTFRMFTLQHSDYLDFIQSDYIWGNISFQLNLQFLGRYLQKKISAPSSI